MDETGAREFLEFFGYDGHSDDLGSALRAFQTASALPTTGEMDPATLERMQAPRCGLPDRHSTLVEAFGLGDAWPSATLAYGFAEVTAQLGENDLARQAIAEAFAIWAEHVPLEFRSVADDVKPDIQIRFVTGEHGDNRSFDGPGNVLAHAFFPPPNGGDLAGDMHFDDAEPWAVDSPVSLAAEDLVTVAVHEVGHALGLGHSASIDSIMFPYLFGTQRTLAPEDIANITALYGRHTHGETTVATSVVIPDLRRDAAGRLQLFSRNSMGGHRRRLYLSGRWQAWEELGGEAHTLSTFLTHPVLIGPSADDVAIFALTHQKNVHVYLPASGQHDELVSWHGDHHFHAGQAGGVGVYMTAHHHPGGPADDHGEPHSLFESELVDGRLTPWREVEVDAGPEPFVVTNKQGAHALLVTDNQRRPKVSRGSVGNWSPFVDISDGEVIPTRTPNQELQGVFSGDHLHVFMVTQDFRLLHRHTRGDDWTPWFELGSRRTLESITVDDAGRVYALSRTRVESDRPHRTELMVFDGTWATQVWAGDDYLGGAAIAAHDDGLHLFLRVMGGIAHVERPLGT